MKNDNLARNQIKIRCSNSINKFRPQNILLGGWVILTVRLNVRTFCFVLRCCLCFILVYFYAFDSVYFQRVYLRSDGFSSQFKNFLSVKCDRIRIENHCKTSFTGNAETCNQLICICIHQSSCASCLRISVVSTQIDFFQRRLSRSQF